jgi:hypothetical protein
VAELERQRVLRALLARFESVKARCVEELAHALAALEAQQSALREARRRESEARGRLEATLRASRVEPGAQISARQLGWDREGVAAVRSALERAIAGRTDADAGLARAEVTAERARAALAEADGRRDAVRRRLEASLRDAAARVELGLEEDVADRWSRR